jgi:hypothetical protein
MLTVGLQTHATVRMTSLDPTPVVSMSNPTAAIMEEEEVLLGQSAGVFGKVSGMP